MDYDVIIIGAGPVGLAFAGFSAKNNLKVGIIEKAPQKALENPAYDGRETALTHLSKKVLEELGAWDQFETDDVSLIQKAKVVNGKSPYVLSFDCEEAKEETLGFMVSNHRIRQAIYKTVFKDKNIDLICESEVTHVETNVDAGRVTLQDGGILKAPLVVAADSRFSKSREMMGVETSKLVFDRTCIVCVMEVENHHDHTAHECFHEDRTLAILPLNNNRVSVVITLPSNDEENIRRMSDEELATDIANRFDGKLGKMKLVTELFSYPLIGVLAKSFYKQRFALLGDAALGMHPVTAHGFNLGLQGAHILSNQMGEALNRGIDFSSELVLGKYNRLQRRTCVPMYHGTNMLVKLYTNNSLPASFARNLLMRVGNRIKPAKDMILNRLTEAH